MRFRDKKGNQSPRSAASVIMITATAPFKPKDDLASLRAYLEDLIKYAANHVKVGSAQLTEDAMVAELTKLFYQPFAILKDTFDAPVLFANQPVNQLRAAIEVLRRYLVAAPNDGRGSTAQIAAPGKLVSASAVTEADY